MIPQPTTEQVLSLVAITPERCGQRYQATPSFPAFRGLHIECDLPAGHPDPFEHEGAHPEGGRLRWNGGCPVQWDIDGG